MNDLSVSDEAVQEATGRSWSEWEETLDEWGGADRSHKELVRLVRERGKVESGWWQQTVVVGYEKLKGCRVTGQTADTGFQVGTQRTIDAKPDAAWKWLTSREGVGAWLGISQSLKFEEGEEYRSEDEVEGEVRVVRPGKRLRVTRQPKSWERASTIQLHIEPKDNDRRTVVMFHEEHLPSQAAREERRKHFRDALDRLRSALE